MSLQVCEDLDSIESLGEWLFVVI